MSEKNQQLSEKNQQLTKQAEQLFEQERLLKQQELDNQLYSLLDKDERLTDLRRAIKDEVFRKQLLAEYHLQ